MDFGTLLQTAKEIGHSSKRDVRYYSTKFTPPKKEEKKAKNLSANIQKFLARKEAEEKQKTSEANKKRDELLALRSKDKKATRRVNVMLKRTKSANQSVIEDAVDNDNTAVTLAGPSQPDEDDYGYVSQEAAAYYNKMMEKYNKMPDDPKFPVTRKKASNNLSSTKDRVKAALEREKEEAMMPHRRKRKHKEDGGDIQVNESHESHNDSDSQDKTEPPPKVKPKLSAPPPLNFSDLLKLAAKKQHEPIMIEVKPKEEEGPLLTKKQKREIEKERLRREGLLPNNKVPPSKPNPQQTENRIPSKPPNIPQNQDRIKKVAVRTEAENRVRSSEHKNNGKISKPSMQSNQSYSNNNNVVKPKLPSTTSQNIKAGDRSVSSSKIQNSSYSMPKPRSADPSPLKTSKPPMRPESASNRMDSNRRKLFDDVPRKNYDGNQVPNKKFDSSKNIERKSLAPKSSSSTLSSTSKPINKSITNTDNHKKDLKFNGNSKDINKSRPLSASTNNLKSREVPSASIQTKIFPPDDLKPKQFPPKDLKPKQFPPKDLKPKQFPPKDLKPKQFPPPDVRRREFPPKDVNRRPMASKRRILDDDEEYDSEMDDFIDDGPEESEDYSRYIRDIFGYDKSKYRGMDEDDIDNMESTFAQQMKEDVRSTRLGLMEDLEDIKREKEEKKRKAMLKKRKL